MRTLPHSKPNLRSPVRRTNYLGDTYCAPTGGCTNYKGISVLMSNGLRKCED